MPLSDAAIRNAKARFRLTKLSDGGGLFLLSNPSGSRWRTFEYRFAGKEKLISLGTDAPYSRLFRRRVWVHAILQDGLARHPVNRLRLPETQPLWRDVV